MNNLDQQQTTISLSDSNIVLQRVLDLPDLQAYYPKNDKGEFERIYIMQYPFVFPSGIKAFKFENPVFIVDRSIIVNEQAEAYFLFQKFEITDNSAEVKFSLNVNYTAKHTNKIHVEGSVTLKKANGIWEISTYKLGAR